MATLNLDLLKAVEAGYQNMSGDKGNRNCDGTNAGTNFGITPKAWADFKKIGCPTEAQMRAITEADALDFHNNWQYGWKKSWLYKLNDDDVANLFYLGGIISRPGGDAVKWMQEILNSEFQANLTADGLIGPKTVAAINAATAANKPRLFNRYRQRWIDHYRNDPNYAIGLVNRINNNFPEWNGDPGGQMASVDNAATTAAAAGHAITGAATGKSGIVGLLAIAAVGVGLLFMLKILFRPRFASQPIYQ